ncbi:MAG: SAVED domain-containing protein [Pseudonocardiaceae bacterium]
MIKPLPPPSATGVRIAGDHYQWLIAWHACVTALRDQLTGEPNPVIRVGVEVDGAGNLDDIVLYRQRPPHTYNQVKYTVDSSTPVNTTYLTTPTDTGGPSILSKITASLRKLTQSGDPVELGFITNRAPDPTDPLIAGRDARTGLLLPHGADGGPRSRRGQTRARWTAAAGLTEPDLLELLAVLRFDLARDPTHLHETVALTMLVSGLRADSSAVAAGADWVARQVRDGHRELDLDAVRRVVDGLQLHAGPARTVVSIATLKPDPVAHQAHQALDWVDRFDGNDAYTKRRPKPPATWTDLQTDIESIPGHLGGAANIVITGSLRQATAFTVGAALRMVTNTDLAVVQRGQLWSSDTPYSAPAIPTMTSHDLGLGGDLGVVIEIATPIKSDVLSFARDHDLPVGRLVVITPPSGPRDNAVSGAADACALAVGIRDAVRSEVRGYARVHLFLAGPMGFALLLGHRWNRVAPTTIYEDLQTDGYEAAFTITA